MDNEDSQDEENDTISSLNGPSQSTSSLPSTGNSQQYKRSGAASNRKAYYSGRSGRELSTSAAKRQSIMALGSIKHLQHMYAKNGLASSSPLSIGSSGKPLPLALPGQVIPSGNMQESPEEDLPPSPSPPPQNIDKSFEVEIPSSRLQKQAVYREIAEVCEKWGLVEMDRFLSGNRREPSTANSSSGFQDVDHIRATSTPSPMASDGQHENLVLNLMNTTTSAIRAAQKYILTLPPEKLPYGASDATSIHAKESSLQKRGPPSALGIITASRPIPRHSMMGVASSKRNTSPSHDKNADESTSHDPLVRLRGASLATLGALKEMEARYRLPVSEEGSSEHLNDSFNDLSLSSADIPHNHPSFNVEDTSVSEISTTSSSTTSRGHLYQADVTLRDLSKEAQIVKEWIETVDSLLSDLTSAAKTPRPRTKSGNLSIESSPVPVWARAEGFEGDKLGRLRACLAKHLPPTLAKELPDDGSSSELLLALSDGQLLCAAYNSVLRSSQRPWGFIPENSIHDVISLTRQREEAEQAQATRSARTSLEVGGSTPMRRQSSEGLAIGNESFVSSSDGTPRIGLTFRRFENLRLFTAAVKLRYTVLIKPEISLKTIARKEDGWEEMLQELAVQWVEAAADEKRNEEPDSD